MAPSHDLQLALQGEQEITFEVLSSLFHLPLSMAAQKLGVCCTALKKKCRKNGISRWPYRTLQSIDKMIKAIETSPQNERASIELEYLQSKRDVIMRKPNFAARGPQKPRVGLDVKKAIAKPSAYGARGSRALSPSSNPLDVLQEAANYADAPGARRLAPAPFAEPRLHYAPQPQQQPQQPQQQQGSCASGYYLQPVAASYSTSQTYAQAGHQVSMHQSVTASMPQGLQKASPLAQHQHQYQQAAARFSPQQARREQLPQQQHPQQAKPISFTFHASRPSRVMAEKPVPKAPCSPPQQRQQQQHSAIPAAWNFELPKLRLPNETGMGSPLPKLRTLEPSAFTPLRPIVETTTA